MNYIELFAGCGGLSLGLESEGFGLVFANELSPMAAETYSFNLLGRDLSLGPSAAPNVLWLSSIYSREQWKSRLSENPSAHIPNEQRYNDLLAADDQLTTFERGSLFVGSILEVNKLLDHDEWPALQNNLLNGGELDLVSGGPPCQSFSMAGLRQRQNERNSLPWAFAEFVKKTKPRIALMENVTGILRAFKSDEQRYFAWYEVAKAFALERYVPVCLHVNAKLVGAAQNRPRFLMFAFRQDVALSLIGKLPSASERAISESLAFVGKVEEHGGDLENGHLQFYDVHNAGVVDSIFAEGPFRHLIKNMVGNDIVGVQDAIDDLEPGGNLQSNYVNAINWQLLRSKGAGFLERKLPKEPMQHERRSNSQRVQARFRLYQLLRDLSELDAFAAKEITRYLRHADASVLTDKVLAALSKTGPWKPLDGGPMISEASLGRLRSEIMSLRTKKQTQRALVAEKPAPAALSIPDDACHYRDGVTRTLTVREMARIQTFPDWFAFKSKVTTGGNMRKFQVPQYTQVGNAVPPLLGKAIGRTCKEFLKLSSK